MDWCEYVEYSFSPVLSLNGEGGVDGEEAARVEYALCALMTAHGLSWSTNGSLMEREQAECGSGFTSKLEGMFKDVELSRDVMASFRESPHARKLGASEVELSVHVLTQAPVHLMHQPFAPTPCYTTPCHGPLGTPPSYTPML